MSWLRKRQSEETAATGTGENLQPPARYAKPKVLTIDISREVSEVLCKAGYNVTAGTFGEPYKVGRSHDLHVVPLDTCSLPYVEEQELVIVDIGQPSPVVRADKINVGEGVAALWQSGEDGIIDPRPGCMRQTKSAFDKIWARGGMFIVFVKDRRYIEYTYAKRAFNELRDHEPWVASNWSMLSDLERFSVSATYGNEIVFDKSVPELARTLRQGVSGAHFHAVLTPHYSCQERWVAVAHNKYGETIAGVLLTGEGKPGVIVLPEMPSAHLFIVELIEQWCARWNPTLFPHLEGAKWVHRPEYEIPQVLALAKQTAEVQERARVEVDYLSALIAQEREANADEYTLLLGTGERLVKAVIRTLGRLGFKDVRDVDEESKAAAHKGGLREDAQIHDRRPTLVIDIKGIHGRPDDEQARQAEKHAIMRMREWNRTDVQPLTIINHQRHLPPRDRDAKAYRDEIIDNAQHTQLGLMTTWDLFRMIRNATKLGWSEDVIKPVFYRVGRIDPIPEHYRGIGAIVDVWKAAFGVIPTEAIRVGDTVAIEVGDSFEEILVVSIQVEGRATVEAPAGSNCGIACDNASERFDKRSRVFLVRL